MVLGKRGLKQLHLVDAGAEIADDAMDSTAAGLGEWARFVNYRKIQLAKLKKRRGDHQRFTPTLPPSGTTAPTSWWSPPAPVGNRWHQRRYTCATSGASKTPAAVYSPERLDGRRSATRRGFPLLLYDTEGYFMGASWQSCSQSKATRWTSSRRLQHRPWCDLTFEGAGYVNGCISLARDAP